MADEDQEVSPPDDAAKPADATTAALRKADAAEDAASHRSRRRSVTSSRRRSLTRHGQGDGGLPPIRRPGRRSSLASEHSTAKPERQLRQSAAPSVRSVTKAPIDGPAIPGPADEDPSVDGRSQSSVAHSRGKRSVLSRRAGKSVLAKGRRAGAVGAVGAGRRRLAARSGGPSGGGIGGGRRRR